LSENLMQRISDSLLAIFCSGTKCLRESVMESSCQQYANVIRVILQFHLNQNIMATLRYRQRGPISVLTSIRFVVGQMVNQMAAEWVLSGRDICSFLHIF